MFGLFVLFCNRLARATKGIDRCEKYLVVVRKLLLGSGATTTK